MQLLKVRERASAKIHGDEFKETTCAATPKFLVDVVKDEDDTGIFKVIHTIDFSTNEGNSIEFEGVVSYYFNTGGVKPDPGVLTGWYITSIGRLQNLFDIEVVGKSNLGHYPINIIDPVFVTPRIATAITDAGW